MRIYARKQKGSSGMHLPINLGVKGINMCIFVCDRKIAHRILLNVSEVSHRSTTGSKQRIVIGIVAHTNVIIFMISTCKNWFQLKSLEDVVEHQIYFGEQNFKTFFLLRAPFGQYGPVAAFELYLYTAVDSRPGPGGSRTTATLGHGLSENKNLKPRYLVVHHSKWFFTNQNFYYSLNLDDTTSFRSS